MQSFGVKPKVWRETIKTLCSDIPFHFHYGLLEQNYELEVGLQWKHSPLVLSCPGSTSLETSPGWDLLG